MRNENTTNQGFAMVTALLLLFLLSGIAVGTMYMVGTERSLGGNDVEDAKAFYGAEAAMEKMMVDVGNLYFQKQAPCATDFTALQASSYQPTITGISYNTYTYSVGPLDSNGCPVTVTRTISHGPNQGLIAQIVPITLTVDASRVTGADVKMIRNVEVALIPVFQFGVFSDGDLAYFPSPSFDFAGRVHTNGNLFLAGGTDATTTPSGNTITFHSKITAYKDIFRIYMTNGVNAQASGAGTGYGGNNVMIPTAPNGCDGSASACRALTFADIGSSSGNYATGSPAVVANPNWTTLSKTTYGGMITNRLTGVRQLSLPFVASGFKAIELIRQPWPNELATSDIYNSRLYSLAQIRVLLSDTQTGFPGGASGYRLANVAPYYDATSGKFGGSTYGSTSNPAFAEAIVSTASTSGTAVYEWGLGGSSVDGVTTAATTCQTPQPYASTPGLSVQTLTTTANNMTDGETVVVGTQTYRFKTTPALAFDVQIGATTAASVSNLASAINADGTTGAYFAGTTQNPATKVAYVSNSSSINQSIVPLTSGVTLTGGTHLTAKSIWTPGSNDPCLHTCPVVQSGSSKKLTVNCYGYPGPQFTGVSPTLSATASGAPGIPTGATFVASTTSAGRQDFVVPSGNTAGGCMDLSSSAHTINANIPYVANYPSNSGNSNCWSLIDGYLLVQARHTDGTYADVTMEWLSFGISRDTNDQANPGQINYLSTISLNPNTAQTLNPGTNNAILKFQTYRSIDMYESPQGFLPSPVAAPGTALASRFSSNPPTTVGTSWAGGSNYTPFDVNGNAAQFTLINPAITNTSTGTNPNLTTFTPIQAASGSGQALTDQDPRKYYPINMFDPREGYFRDSFTTGASIYQCSAFGVINIIELDVNNLRRWLSGALVPTPSTGAGVAVENATQNGYMLYFSDRRGMQADPAATLADGTTGSRITGGFGMEDVVNPLASATIGTPNGTLDSGEDSNLNGTLDTWGAASVGTATGTTYSSDPLLMIGINAAGSGAQATPLGTSDPDSRNCQAVGRKNRVSGARHALRLVNGTLGNLPSVPPASGANIVATGGFTVASENPVYVLGEYNANATQAFSEAACSTVASGSCHVAAAIIADSVTLLSNPGMGNATSYGFNDYAMWAAAVKSPSSNRMAQTTYYRTAIAAGKNPSFVKPSNVSSPIDFGTDGGVHNFLRFVEDWSDGGGTSNPGSALHYTGSLISLYYSEYSTSTFKSANTTFVAPTRGYSFDIDFLTISLLPPGTPKFRDVDNIGFQQIFTPY